MTKTKNPLPTEILKRLDSLAPFQREGVAATYTGIGISWDVKFIDISTLSNGKTFLFTRYMDGNNWCNITAEVELASYPQLKITKKDEVLTVEGVIDSIDARGILRIHLRDIKIAFVAKGNIGRKRVSHIKKVLPKKMMNRKALLL